MATSNEQKLFYRGTYYTNVNNHSEIEIKWTRHYKTLTNGMKRAVEIIMLDASPMDMVEISDDRSGLCVGWAKLKPNGSLEVVWLKPNETGGLKSKRK